MVSLVRVRGFVIHFELIFVVIAENDYKANLEAAKAGIVQGFRWAAKEVMLTSFYSLSVHIFSQVVFNLGTALRRTSAWMQG